MTVCGRVAVYKGFDDGRGFVARKSSGGERMRGVLVMGGTGARRGSDGVTLPSYFHTCTPPPYFHTRL